MKASAPNTAAPAPAMPYQRDQRAILVEPQPSVDAAPENAPAHARSHGLLRSFRFAADGFAHTLRTQRNFRIQVVCAVLALAAGALLKITHLQWIVVVAMIALVLSLELINTATEAVVDMITADYHPLAKVAKDAAAAAVLIASFLSVVVAAIIFIPCLPRLLHP